MNYKPSYDPISYQYGLDNIKEIEIPDCIADNLKSDLRPYQIEAFQRFIICWQKNYYPKIINQWHLLYNMATGSGKTLIMAGLMLYLYQQGYRNFIFFVSSKNIIDKTKMIFLDISNSKYLFKNEIIIDNKRIDIKNVNNFYEAYTDSINIKFTTIQQLHSNLNESRENSLFLDDLKDLRIVLLSDEAHHMQTQTKSKQSILNFQSKPSWENTVERIFKQNTENVLLEFTATLVDTIHREKYLNKRIFQYNLIDFRKDRYSKEIMLLRSEYNKKERILLALILNLYRQKVANKYSINCKPVILFKSKLIKESEENEQYFYQLINNLSEKDIRYIHQTAQIKDELDRNLIFKAFEFFKNEQLTFLDIVLGLKISFKEENCLNVNKDEDISNNQIILNTLEDNNNPIRVIFAVNKLNEGWDVLNLFDIVRLYETRDSGSHNKIGKTTTAEAQLIGRGARYFPFSLRSDDSFDKYQRKFDNRPEHDLKILEELYYHTKEDSRYIYELKQALIKEGIYSEKERKELRLKEEFKLTKFYQQGLVFLNTKIKRNYTLKPIDKPVAQIVLEDIVLPSGFGKVSYAYGDYVDILQNNNQGIVNSNQDIYLKSIPKHITMFALSSNPFFYFNNLKRYYPQLKTLYDFIENNQYLGLKKIKIKSNRNNLNNSDYLYVMQKALKQIQDSLKQEISEYTGSDFKPLMIKNVFKDKDLFLDKNTRRSQGQIELVKQKDWYVFNDNYGTDQEKNFVEIFNQQVDKLKKKYSQIYLIRNERELKIIDNQGRGFEPDFLLFCIEKNGQQSISQVFIEPKGAHLIKDQEWKEQFLQQIQQGDIPIDNKTQQKYHITAIPIFYNDNCKDEFKQRFIEILKI